MNGCEEGMRRAPEHASQANALITSPSSSFNAKADNKSSSETATTAPSSSSLCDVAYLSEGSSIRSRTMAIGGQLNDDSISLEESI